MSAQYLLPCKSCGSTTPIDASQAGASVVCRCGESIEVPSLRAIRQLAPSEPASPGQSTRTRQHLWNPAAGMIFASGTIIALVGASMAVFMHMNSIQANSFELPPENEVADWIAEVDTASPEELFEMWNVSRHLGLGEYGMSPFVQARQAAQRFAMYRNLGLIVLACGLAFAGTSLCLRRKSS